MIWFLFADFKTAILCSVHSIWFVKYVLSAKVLFVKTSTRIVKCESRVVKSNPGDYYAQASSRNEKDILKDRK